MALESSRTLGGIGALLIVIGLLGLSVPYAGILALIGVILLFIGLKGLADAYGDRGIFNNALYALVIGIVGVVVGVASIFITALATLSSLLVQLGISLTNVTDWNTVGAELAKSLSNPANFGVLITLISVAILALIIVFVFAIVSVFFFRKSLRTLAAKTEVSLFGTAGLLMLIGAVLTIILVGFILIWIAWILVTVAFFQIRTQPAQAPQPQTPPS